MNLCRLCYENEANINIFECSQLCIKIRRCCGAVSIHKDDGLPSLICKVCDHQLDACYRFLLKCEATDQKIRLLIESAGLTPKTEIKSEDIGLEDDFHDDDDLPIVKKKEPCESFTFEYKNERVSKSEKSPKKYFPKRVKLNKDESICSVCGRKCLSSSALTIHMRTHTNERPHGCPSCEKAYKDTGTLKRHIERNHLQKRERRFICENCGKGFYTKSDIQIHMRVHTGETPYSCSICPARFTQLSAMLRHKRRHTDAKSHVCPACGKPFWTKEELKKHSSVHVDVRNFSCPICSVLFKHKGSFQKHMRIHSEPNRFICNHCGKTCNNKGNLKSHMERLHSEKAGDCDICLKNVSNIEEHMWRHTGHRPHKCDACSSSFYEMKALAHHINFKHKKADKFKCTVEGCPRSFPSKPMLTFHVAKYHDHRPLHSCQRCSRGFYRKNDLARHMLGTHKEKMLK